MDLGKLKKYHTNKDKQFDINSLENQHSLTNQNIPVKRQYSTISMNSIDKFIEEEIKENTSLYDELDTTTNNHVMSRLQTIRP